VRAPLAGELRLRTGGATGKVGSFGPTRRNADGTPKRHWGIDLLCEEGEPVRAAHAGMVTRAGWENPSDPSQGYGLRVYLQGEIHLTRYCHLKEILVEPGDTLNPGDLIGLAGRTGNILRDAAIPTHLHFEVRRGLTPVDPWPLLHTT
jgi:murein DD-endopeptidase MepM/ murein hydrolase activator NlpD